MIKVSVGLCLLLGLLIERIQIGLIRVLISDDIILFMLLKPQPEVYVGR